MYNPGALTELVLKNGAKIKRSRREINDAIAASPQAKIVVHNDDVRFYVGEESECIVASFITSISAPVSMHIGDTELHEVEYGDAHGRLMCRAVLDTATMRIQEDTIHFDRELASSREDVTSNRDRLLKEAKQQALQMTFSRQYVAEHCNEVIISYARTNQYGIDPAYAMKYLRAVRLGLVEDPEPWVQALVDDLRDQCGAVFDDEETYCDPASAEAGHGSFPNDLYPIRDRIHNILFAGVHGEGEWAVYAPLIRAATTETVRKLYKLPEELPLPTVDDLPVSAEDTKTLGELLSLMDMIGVSIPEQETLVKQHQLLEKLHQDAPGDQEFFAQLLEGEWEEVVERITSLNELFDSVKDCFQFVTDALKALRWHLKTNGVLRTLYEVQEKRGKVKPLQDLNCLALGAYLRSGEEDEKVNGTPVSELNTFLPHEYVFAVEDARGEQVRSDCADFLAHFIPFPVYGVSKLFHVVLPVRISAVDALIISALTRSKKPYSTDEHRSLLEACVCAGMYDTSYVESCGEEELSAIAPHLNVLEPLLSKQEELYGLLDTVSSTTDEQGPAFGDVRTLVQAIADTMPLLDSLYCMNKQWVSVQNHLLRDGVPMDKERQLERKRRSEVVDMCINKLHLTDADLERVEMSHQLLLGESEELVASATFTSFCNRSLDVFFAVPGYSWPDYFLNAHDREYAGLNRDLHSWVYVPTSQIEVDWGGLQARVVREIFWAFISKMPQRDVVFTKDESECILDYVRTGNVRSANYDNYTWGTTPSYDDALEALISISRSLWLDSDGHIVITPPSLEDEPERRPERREGGRVANERARLANELYSRAEVSRWKLKTQDHVIAVGGTGSGNTCRYMGQEVPHFRGTADDLLALRYTRSGFSFIKEFAELAKADPRTQTTYWILHHLFQYEFIHQYATERRR